MEKENKVQETVGCSGEWPKDLDPGQVDVVSSLK